MASPLLELPRVSMDSHVKEPDDLWVQRLPASLKDRAPRRALGDDGKIHTLIEGVNLVKTAEGALNEVHNLLQEMRTLAVHAANTGVNSTADVAADQAQLDKAVASIQKASRYTRCTGCESFDAIGIA